MKGRVVALLACAPIVVGMVGAATAAPASAPAPAQQPQPPPRRIVLVGDSTAVTLFPFLRDAAAPHGLAVASAARIGCGVIDGEPKLDDGRPYVDYYGDTTKCAGIAQSLQSEALARQNPDLILWISAWESWPNRMVDGQLARFGTIDGNKTILGRIDAAVGRLTANGARLTFLPVPPNAYPSVPGVPNPPSDSRLADLAKMLRAYARQHSDKTSLIDLPTILRCPTETSCPAEVAPGLRPRNLDGFHFDGEGGTWVADQVMGMVLGTTPAPAPPTAPACAAASLGARSAAAADGKCVH